RPRPARSPCPCARWRLSMLVWSCALGLPRGSQCAAGPRVVRDCRAMIRIGILGAARIAPRAIVTPANALLGAEVVAVASRDLDRARNFAAQHSIPLALGSYAELIARDDV